LEIVIWMSNYRTHRLNFRKQVTRLSRQLFPPRTVLYDKQEQWTKSSHIKGQLSDHNTRLPEIIDSLAGTDVVSSVYSRSAFKVLLRCPWQASNVIVRSSASIRAAQADDVRTQSELSPSLHSSVHLACSESVFCINERSRQSYQYVATGNFERCKNQVSKSFDIPCSAMQQVGSRLALCTSLNAPARLLV
jgi:hypothetical protein